MLRLLVSMAVMGAMVGCSGTKVINAPPNVPSQASSVRIEVLPFSPMPAADLLYAPKSPHGPILIALYTNRLSLVSPIDGRTIQENSLSKRFGFPHLVYIQDQPLLMNSGDGFSDLYLMDLQGRILWTYEKEKTRTQSERAVSVMGQMTFGDLDKDGEPEFYVSSMKAPKQYVHLLNKDGQFVRFFSEGENSIPCDYYPITCQAETFIGVTYDSEKRQPLLDFRAASGELKQRVSLETDRLEELHPLDWPMRGNYCALDRKGMFYVLQRDGSIVAKLEVGGTRLNHTIVTAANSNQKYLVLLSTFRRSQDKARLNVLDKNFSQVGGKDVEVTWGICVAAPERKEFFLGGESGIFRCRLLE